MARSAKIPDAWDDDWEAQADQDAKQTPTVTSDTLSKAERLAQHEEKNREIWQSADSPQTFHYLQASNPVPLTTNFKPQIKVLSRKPVIAKRDPATGMAQLSLDPAEDDDDNNGPDPGDSVNGGQISLEEKRALQQRQKEEKQRKYDEARAKIFGGSAPSSGTSSPGTVTPPRLDSAGRRTPQDRGRGRAGDGGLQKGNDARQTGQRLDPRRQDKRAGGGSSSSSTRRELFDPGYSPKPETSRQRGQRMNNSPGPSQDLATPIRDPRGPDASGKKGFGMSPRQVNAQD